MAKSDPGEITRYTDPAALSPGTMLTQLEVAVILRTSVHMLKNWRRDRVGPPWVEIGQQRLYRAGDLAVWIEKRSVDIGEDGQKLPRC